MLSLFRGAVMCGAALMLAASSAAAQTGSITGKITTRGSGQPVAGAQVQAISNASVVGVTTSGDDGTYTLTGLPANTYTVLARRLGMEFRLVEGVVVSAGGRATVDVVTSPLVAQLDQMTASANRGAQPEKILDSPNSISVVPQVQIAERAAATVTDHLKALPGLSISTGGIAQANIVSRGFNNAFSGSMLMLQDYRFAGVPSLRVNVPFLFTGSNEDIDRIEVLQGPAAALYGPNSGGGVLHVITKSPFDSKGTTLTVAGGQQSFGRISGRHAGVIGSGKLGYKLSGEMFTAKDFEYIDPNEDSTGSGASRAAAKYSSTDDRIPASRRGQTITRDFSLKKQTGEARVDYRPDANTELITTAGYSKFGSGLEITTTFGAAQAKEWSYTNFQERFRHKDFFAQVFYDKSDAGNSNAADDAGTYYLRSGIPVVDRSTVLVGQVQQRLNYRTTKIVVGGEYNATRPVTEGTINGRNDNDDDINEYGGYIQTTTPFAKQFEFLASVRGDGNSRITGAQFSPRAALVFKMTPTQNFRVTFNRAFNSPASFSFFLDQYSGQTPAPGMPVQIMGNPPKTGWEFARGGDCATGAGGGLCMRSPYIPGALAPASAAAAYAGFAQALPSIVAGLPVSSFGTAGEAGRAQLLGLLSPAQLGNIINSLRPTDAQVGTNLVDLGTKAGVTSVSDIAPLTASFTNTWEVGYKGILGKRVSLSADLWFQRRPAEPTSQLINPGVLFNPQQLGAFLGTGIATALITAGVPAATASAQASAAAAALTPLMAAIPVGATALNSPLYDKSYLVYTYRPATGYVNVNGIDLAGNFTLAEDWSLAATYSTLNKNVFYKKTCSSPGDPPGCVSTAAEATADSLSPLTANVPKNRISATLRYESEKRGYTAELRGRYADGFPVNSGVFNSYNVGTPTPYPAVPVNALVDLNASWKLPMAKGAQLSLTATNILDNRVQTFVGVPKIGRLIVTQLRYTW